MEPYSVKKIMVVSLTEGPTWYKVGEVFPAIFDLYVGKFLATGNSGAGRYVLVEDCEIIE